MKKLLIGSLIVGLSFQAAAQVKKKISLNEAISIALENNYGLQIAENNEQVAQQVKAAATSGFLPKVNATASTISTRSDVRQELSTGNTISRNGALSSNTNAAVSLTYTIFDGLKMFATYEKSRLQSEAATVLMKQEMLNTVEEVTLSYCNLVRLGQQMSALEELMKISEERIKIADAKLNAGLSPKTEWLQSKILYNAQKSAYISVKGQLPAARQQLSKSMGLAELAEYETEENIRVKYSPNFQLVQNAISSNNSSLIIAKKNQEIREQEVKELRAGMLPKLDFVSSYAYSRAQSQAGLLLVNQNQGLNYGFTISIPLFGGFVANKGLKIASLNASSAMMEVENIKNQLAVETVSAWYTFDNSRELLILEEENTKLAKENVGIALERFRQSQTSVLELQEAEQSLEEAQNRLINARYQAKAAELRLRNLSGDLIK